MATVHTGVSTPGDRTSGLAGQSGPMWRRGLVEPRRAHILETEDGAPRIIPTDQGSIPVAICQAWLVDTTLATDELARLERCTICAGYFDQIAGAPGPRPRREPIS